MEDLSKYTNLHRRNGRYYFRARVPLDLVVAIGKKEIKKSLGTSDLSEARSKLAIEQLKADELFNKTRNNLSPPISNNAQNISPVEIERRVLVWYHEEAERQAKEDDSIRAGMDSLEKETILENLHEEQNALESGSPSTYMHSSNNLLKLLFNECDLQTRRVAIPLIHQAQIELLYKRLARFDEFYQRQPFQTFRDSPPPSRQFDQDTNTNITWGKLLEKFKAEQVRANKTPKTINGYRLTFNFSSEFFGENKLLNAITREDCRNYIDSLSRLPANAKKRYPRLSLLDAIKAASEAPESHLARKTVSGNLAKLSTILEFAVSEGYLNRNPAKKIELPRIKSSKKDERQPFDEFALNRIFNAPIYIGCIDDEYNYNRKGSNHPKRHRYWIPLIAMFTGMRLNEICQLHSSDITEIENIPSIIINDEEEKTLKNISSVRNIPIHNKLIELGFLEYTSAIKRQGHKQLFPLLSGSSTGGLSDNFSKWFNRFLKSCGVKQHNDKMTFHSFRHGFRDAAREARIPREIVAQIGGWRNSSDAMDGYGNGLSIATLDEEIQKITYLLNLSHLKP